MSEKPDGALSRWSQRKHAARVAARGGAAPTALKEADEPVVSDVQPQLAPDARANLPADASGAERKAERTPVELRPPLTPIEELTAESDYTQFLAEHVPEALRRAALRQRGRPTVPVTPRDEGLGSRWTPRLRSWPDWERPCCPRPRW